MNRLLNLFVVALLLTVAASCKKDDPKPAQGAGGTAPQNPPTEQKVEVTSVTINPTTLALEVGKTSKLTATVAPTNATNKTITWSSSNADIATVDNTGIVTAKAIGETTITATSNNGKTATCKVIATNVIVEVEGVTLNKTTLTLAEETEGILTATVAPENATDKTITWSSSNEAVATVDSKTGKVTAVAIGEATITATSNNGKTAECKVTIIKGTPIEGVSITRAAGGTVSGDAIKIKQGSNTILLSNVTPKGAIGSLTWESSNPSIARVVLPADGSTVQAVINGVSAGEVTITLRSNNGKTATQKVIVTEPDLITSVTLDKSSLTLQQGKSEQIKVTVTTSQELVNKSVTWTSSDESVATVEPMGGGIATVVAKKGGTATITVASVEDPTKRATCTVTVDIAVTGVSISPTNLIIDIGQEKSLTATVTPSNATNKNVTWSSSNATVAKVNNVGRVTGLSAGAAIITATSTSDPTKQATCIVSVTNVVAVTSITIYEEGSSYPLAHAAVAVNEQRRLRAEIDPTNATNKTVTWTTSNSSIATVSSTGVVIGKSAGDATITATAGNVSKSCTVRVYNKDVTHVWLTPKSLTLNAGESHSLSAQVFPEDATNKKVTWKTSNSSVATVSSSGVVTAQGYGNATITVTTEDGGKTDICSVSVNPIAVTGITLNRTEYRVKAGNSYSGITATISPSNATNKNVTWTIDDTDVAEITSQSNSSVSITVKRIGYALVTATTQDGNKVATCLLACAQGNETWRNTNIPVRTIQSGEFTMGKKGGSGGSDPAHKVRITKNFVMSKFMITNYQFVEFLNKCNVPSDGYFNHNQLIKSEFSKLIYSGGKWEVRKGYEHCPVVGVTWYGADDFATWAGGRLPTEAEWEYACRAGTTTDYYWGNSSANIGNYAWYEDNSNSELHPVGKKNSNNWFLFDMIGNGKEWCSDWFDMNYYSNSPTDDPTGPKAHANITRRVLRSGSNSDSSELSTVYRRGSNPPGSTNNVIGFRVVFDN